MIPLQHLILIPALMIPLQCLFKKETIINLRKLSYFYFSTTQNCFLGDKSVRLAEPKDMSISKALGVYCPSSNQKGPSDPHCYQHFRRTVLYGLDHLMHDAILNGLGVGMVVYVGTTYFSTL